MNYRTIVVLGFLSLWVPSFGGAASADRTASRFPIQFILDHLQGKVQVLSKGATVAEDAQEDQVVVAGDTIMTGSGAEVSLVLNSMTMVHVSENSRVTVDALARKGSKGFLSRLKLAVGKVLAQVEKLGSSRSTFEVEAGGVVCGVRGTAFEVSAEGTNVQDSTYEGAVEMKAGAKAQMVPADHHMEFSGDQRDFSLRRLVTDRERERYRNWKRFQDLAIRRQKEREAALRSFEALQKPERDQLWDGLGQVRVRDRFLILRRIMRENNLKDRQRILDESVKVRMNAVHEREIIRQKALEERERNLKQKHPKTE